MYEHIYQCVIHFTDDAEESESFGVTSSVMDYPLCLKKHNIRLFNCAVGVVNDNITVDDIY